jgi:integrase
LIGRRRFLGHTFHLAAEEYSYTVVYHVRDLIKAALAEAVDQEVLERNVARKTVIPEIEESDTPVLPVEMYAKLLAGLDGIRDRAIFLIACFCALRPSELFGLTWGCYTGNVFTIVNTAWRDRLQRKKIKRKNRYGRTNYRLVAIPQAVRKAIDLWRARCPNPDTNALMFPEMQARARKPPATPIHPDNWLRLRLRLYPVAKRLGMAFHPTFQVLRRSFSTTWQERSTPDRDAGPTRTQRHSNHPGHLHPDYKPGSGKDGEPSHKPHTRLRWGG